VSEPEFVHMKPADAGASCWAHEQSTAGLAGRLLIEMRRSHGKGGVNVCRDCLKRAANDARHARP
jgi:hypothetical protein